MYTEIGSLRLEEISELFRIQQFSHVVLLLCLHYRLIANGIVEFIKVPNNQKQQGKFQSESFMLSRYQFQNDVRTDNEDERHV